MALKKVLYCAFRSMYWRLFDNFATAVAKLGFRGANCPTAVGQLQKAMD